MVHSRKTQIDQLDEYGSKRDTKAVHYFLVAEWNMISPGVRMCIACVASGLRIMRYGMDDLDTWPLRILVRVDEHPGGPKLSDTAMLKKVRFWLLVFLGIPVIEWLATSLPRNREAGREQKGCCQHPISRDTWQETHWPGTDDGGWEEHNQ